MHNPGLPIPIKAVIFDFDGVFTDNKVIVDEDGRESVICDRSDGWGISKLQKTGLPLLVVSTEKNPVVLKRCEKLCIPCVQGIDDKKGFLSAWLNEHEIDGKNVVFVGNDVNDTECLTAVGCGVVVADAHEDVKKIAKIVLKHNGGKGAVRELCDMVISGKKMI